MSVDVKKSLARAAAGFAKFWFRHGPVTSLNSRLWSSLCARRINWRGLRLLGRTRDGLEFQCDSRDLIQAYLYYFGVWEPHVTGFIRRRLVRGAGFVDVGANIGYYALVAAKAGAQVVAIEALPATFRMLLANIERNRLGGAVRPVNRAAGDREGEIELYVAGDSNIGATSAVFDPEAEWERTERIPMVPFDRLITDQEASVTRLIKIDIEGAEVPVLRRIAESIQRFPKDVEVVVEFRPESCAESACTPEHLLSMYGDLGFHAYEIRNSYGPGDYLRRAAAEPPTRLSGPPTTQMDLVFSRVDAPSL